MGEFDEMNRQVIAEFRANDGKVGGFFENAYMLLLHTRGAKSGKEYINPLMGLPVGDRMAVFASVGGAPRNPAWYHNVKANPDVTVEYGTETYPARAVEVTGEERDRIFTEMKTRFTNFADYEAKTTRTIPVILLERTG